MRSPAWDNWVAKARAVRIEDEIARRSIKLNGGTVEREGPCPKCGGDDRFSINTTKQVFNCRGCGIKGDVIALVEALDNIDFSHAVETLTGESPPKSNGKRTNKDATKNDSAWTSLAKYIYCDRHGKPYLLVKKFIDEHGKKQYPQFYWDGAKWEKGRPKGPKIPYHLPELLAAPIGTTIVIVEGEKCANALAKLGFVATTNSEGAAHGGKDDSGKKWTPELNAYFKGHNVVIIGDNDAPGRRHVRYVAKQLHGIAESVRVLDLAEHWPSGNMPEGDDVADFLEHHDLAGSKLAKLCKEAPLWDPSADDAEDELGDEAKSDAEGDDELIAS
jgi:CHC2 zinc finger